MHNSSGDARHTEQIEAHGLKALRLRASGSEALVYLNGAHVTSFSTAEHGELLWVSERSLYSPGQAIRGGIPLCFPWFGANAKNPSFPAHGFARRSEFKFEGSELRGNLVVAELTLAAGPDTEAWFPHAFTARLRVSVGTELCVALEVENSGASEFDYEVALHTYLSVSDVRQVSVTGLEAASYDDKVTGERGARQSSSPLTLVGETDRVYDSTSRVTVTDAARGRRTIVDKTCSQSTVVWNPWIEKAQRMADFGDEEWPGMLCVEAANVSPHGIHLTPQSRHTTTTIVSAETS
jgi:glucose-6-phosphate 1-epimerase